MLSDGSGDAPTIQAGIDSAQTDDHVLVGPGTYLENIDFMGKNIVVESEAGAAATTIDGSGRDSSCVVFRRGEGNEATLSGFTLTGGTGSRTVSGGERLGGGVFIWNSEPTLQQLKVVDNTAVLPLFGASIGTGGGIYCLGYPNHWHPRIVDCEVLRNRAGANGGGIAACAGISLTVTNSIISENLTEHGDGGGLWFLVLVQSSVKVLSSQVSMNRAADHGGGILVAANGPSTLMDVELAGNLIWRNEAVGAGSWFTNDSGGGLYLFQTAGHIHHNTLVANTGGGVDTTLGGGIAFARPGSPLVEKNIIAFTGNGGAIHCARGSTPIISNNLFWDNVGGTGIDSCGTAEPSDGNVFLSPLFCDRTGGVFTVAADSPALSHPAGPLGAFPDPGCPASSPIIPTTWGRIKLLFRP